MNMKILMKRFFEVADFKYNIKSTLQKKINSATNCYKQLKQLQFEIESKREL